MTTIDVEPMLEQWERDGFFVAPQLFPESHVVGLVDAAIAIAREVDVNAIVVPEGNVWPGATEPEHRVAKLFRIHDRQPFRSIALAPAVLEILGQLIGPDVDLFLSQFIFKWPEAYGQPWHQDSFYFPYDPDRQVGVWTAANRATLANGCLHVVPGTHREPVHAHVPDARPNVTASYYEIVDHDMGSSIAVEMQPGDVLFFDSHLMHASTDNQTDELRAAYVCHYTPMGTRLVMDYGEGVTDWGPALRSEEPV